MRGGIPPRFHNALSYGVAALVLPLSVRQERPAVILLVAAWVFHFLRRTFEALFVHRYSGRPVPPLDYLVEYLYYWGFAYWIARGLSGDSWGSPSPLLWGLGLGIFVAGEAGNAWAHQKLRALRSGSGSTERTIPRGGFFEFVSCPHYLFEITSWVGFAILARVVGAIAFLGLGAAIVTTYALSRHRAYRNEFVGEAGKELYPASRKAIFPFVL